MEKQSSIIVNSITGLTEQLAKNNTANSLVHVAECGPAFEFKHEGEKIQFGFNQEKISKLSEIEGLIKEGDLAKVALVITKQKAILKIDDRQGWDTVHEYLNDPLANSTEDAAKLRYAVSRAARKCSLEQGQYDRRRGNFAPNDFFRGFSQSYNSADKFNTETSKVGSTGFQFQRERAGCFYCCQVSHMVRLPLPQRPTNPILVKPKFYKRGPKTVKILKLSMFDLHEQFEYEQNVKVVSVKSKLKKSIEFWNLELDANNFILNTIRCGYAIPLKEQPTSMYLKKQQVINKACRVCC